MVVVTVSLLAEGIPYEELTYFSKLSISPGDLVEVAVKKRTCRALVLQVSPLQEEKQTLKNASFVTKKISTVLQPHFLSEDIWNAILFSSSYLLRSPGVILNDLISEKAYTLLSAMGEVTQDKGFEMLLLEQKYAQRVLRYKTTIREMFSKKKSLVIFFPTIVDLENAKEELSKGIPKHVVVFHGSITEKSYDAAMLSLKDDTHPVVILSTPSLLPWMRKDLGLVVVEKEHSSYYYTHGPSGYDMRFVIESIARHTRIPYIVGSHMLSLRAHRLHLLREANELMPLQYRNDSTLSIVPMTQENMTSSPYLSLPALKLLEDSKKAQAGHIFIYAHRKGMYPTTICADCGELFACATCGRPYVLHKISGVRTYVCHECEDIVHLSEDSSLSCRYCGGWRMMTLGIATTGIEEELSMLNIPLFVIDGERTPTRAKAKKVYKEWLESPFGVLIGTEMAHNLVTRCDAAIVLSIDSLFSLPEYRVDEKILSLISELSEKVTSPPSTYKTFIMQTRMPNNPVVQYLTAPSFRQVYEVLLKERETYLFPPFYTIIKASFENSTDVLRKKIEEELEPYTVYWFEQGKGITLLFIHIKESTWFHDAELRKKIKAIVSNASPSVNPLYLFS